jgi:hypothetical protein
LIVAEANPGADTVITAVQVLGFVVLPSRQLSALNCSAKVPLLVPVFPLVGKPRNGGCGLKLPDILNATAVPVLLVTVTCVD